MQVERRECVYRTIQQLILHNITWVFENIRWKNRNISYVLLKTALD